VAAHWNECAVFEVPGGVRLGGVARGQEN